MVIEDCKWTKVEQFSKNDNFIEEVTVGTPPIQFDSISNQFEVRAPF